MLSFRHNTRAPRLPSASFKPCNLYGQQQTPASPEKHNRHKPKELHETSPGLTGVTEIVLASEAQELMLMPTLAHLSRQPSSRWFTWLSLQPVMKTELLYHQFDLDRIRVGYPKTRAQCFELLKSALTGGNSETVVAAPGKLSDNQIQQLEEAAQAGRCSALLIRTR